MENAEVGSFLTRKEFGPSTIEWEPGLDTALPIKGEDIPGFRQWIAFNDFHLDPRNPLEGHDGFDFAAYLDEEGKVILGLPAETKIRAVADGRLSGIGYPDSYAGTVRLEHGEDNSGMFSEYVHVVSDLERGSRVKKGDVIGTLYKDPDGEEGRLVHLHLSLINGWDVGGGVFDRKVDPAIIDPTIKKHRVTPMGSSHFTVDSMPGIEVRNAHFKNVRVNER